jgi:UDP-N-acetylglucosamine:LPS N-acetylglucosamine transferase
MFGAFGARVRSSVGSVVGTFARSGDAAATAGANTDALSPAAELAHAADGAAAQAAMTAGFGDAVRGRRILVFTMNSGGHAAMARSIEQQVARLDPTAQVHIVDGWGVPGPPQEPGRVKRALARLHDLELRYTPWTYEAQHALRYTRPGIRAERAVNTRLFQGRVEQYVDDIKPDVIVSTHERLTSPLGKLRRTDQLQVPVVATLIDSAPHGMWLEPGVDQHVLYNANDMSRLGAVFAGGPDDTLRAVVARPPVDPRAFAQYDRAAVRASFDLPTDRKVALMSGGSTGLPIPDEEIRRLIDETDFHLAIATGRNEVSFAHIAATFPPDRVTPIGFTKEMPSLIATSDVAVLNANGATSLEAFAAQTPVVVFNPVAGHGFTSARAIDADGLATFADDTDKLVDTLRRVADDDPDVAARVARARAIHDQQLSYGDVIVGARLAH